MKNLFILATATGMALLLSVGAVCAQENKGKAVKPDQVDLVNDLYAAFGTGTLFYFVENDDGKANTLLGTFIAGYSRGLNPVVAIGFQTSFTRIGRTEKIRNYSNNTYHNKEHTDNLWQATANVRFRYLNKPSFCMYSGFAIGITLDYYDNTELSEVTSGQKLLPAGQLTLLGFRVGRKLGFFGEFGIGTHSILHGGISYKLAD